MTNKDWLILSIITFLTVAVWTIFDIHHAQVTSTISESQKELIKPLDPQLDTEIFDRIKNRQD